jgi:DNA-binding transcriptional LysR family regulator
VDLDQLRIFLEIVRLGSFSRAAEACFRSQPAVSAQIRQLEEEIGARLFDRVASRVTLTAAGRRFAEHARLMLDLRKRAVEEIAEMATTPKGELSIGASEATILYLLPKVFADYKRLYPQVQVSIARIHGTAVVQRVLENSLDFGVAQAPISEQRLVRAPIHRDEIALLVPWSHPLAKLAQAGPEDLLPYPVLLPKSGRTRTMLDDFLEAVRDDLNVSMEMESSEMIKRFVLAGLGVSFLATAFAREEVASRSLKCVPLRGGMSMQLALVYRKDKPLTRAALAFIEVATKGVAA